MQSAKSRGKDKGCDSKTTILVVDDDADICVALEMILDYEGFEVWTAANGRLALLRLDHEEAAGRRADLILTDVKMPDLDGIGLLEKVRERENPPPVVMISGHGDVATAVDAVRRGAVDFLEKPLDQNRVIVSLRNALRQEKLVAENAVLKQHLAEGWELVGESEQMARLREEIDRIAPADLPVLITGDNGTGKEVVARNLHLRGPRAGGPFVPVNCAAIPSELIESELFGHEKGSFTGAHERRIGHFQAAHGGTLFLDEIGDMPPAAQAKVLRALETREISRVGGSDPILVDIRVVAATNADLAAAVEEKTFRVDLFYRLNVLPVHIPPLREHPDDVPLLAQHFLAEIARRTGRRPRSLDPAAVTLLRSLPYPGNVRQLRNILEAAHVFAEGAIGREDLQRILENGPAMTSPAHSPETGGEDPFESATFEEFKNASEALFFRRKLDENEGNVKRTAERLNMQRSHLYKKLGRYELR
jgi:two-component system, NtrC family, nitrogen regulation response regulator NtrX